MAEIERRQRGHAIDYCVGWIDHEDIGRERYFRSYRAAEKFALQIETTLLNEAVESLCEALRSKAGASNDTSSGQ